MINANEVQKPNETMAPAPEPMVKLDLACGDSKAEGFIGVDIYKTPAVDILQDLTETPWPFGDSSVDEARCSHFFEHLTPEQRTPFMNELWRVLKPGAGCIFITPRGFDRQVQDFNHQWPPIVETSYNYWSRDFYKANPGIAHYLDLYKIQCDFDVRPMQVSVTQDFATRPDDHKMFAIRNYTNVAYDLVVLMVAKK